MPRPRSAGRASPSSGIRRRKRREAASWPLWTPTMKSRRVGQGSAAKSLSQPDVAAVGAPCHARLRVPGNVLWLCKTKRGASCSPFVSADCQWLCSRRLQGRMTARHSHRSSNQGIPGTDKSERFRLLPVGPATAPTLPTFTYGASGKCDRHSQDFSKFVPRTQKTHGRPVGYQSIRCGTEVAITLAPG